MMCEHKNKISVTSKCSDCCYLKFFHDGRVGEHEGYVPKNIGIGGGDYIEFDYCADCGMILGDFPVDWKEV